LSLQSNIKRVEAMKKPIAAIVGAGRTRFGEFFKREYMSLALEAGQKALDSANMQTKELGAIYGGFFLPEITEYQGLSSSSFAEEMDINIPITRVEAACASGGLALYNGCLAIQSGRFDKVLVGGVEKLTNTDATSSLSTAMSSYERLYNFTFPDLYASMAGRHMHDYGTKREHLAMVAVKNHKHAKGNEHAQFRNPITIDTVINSAPVAKPLTLLDCSPISDGAAAIVLVKPELAKDYENAVLITGSDYATGSVGLYSRKTAPTAPLEEKFTSIRVTKLASEEALKMSGITLKDIDIAEVHDCFTIEEILAMEDIGLCEKGKGGFVVEDSFDEKSSHIVYKTDYGEKIFNCGGGLKADGHPVSATGVRQAVECYEQLSGISCHPVDRRLGKRPDYALIHNIGGSGAAGVVHILEVK
jgi:acetyl-CoA C-acetyltransferase